MWRKQDAICQLMARLMLMLYGKVPCTRQLTKEEVREAYEVHTGNVIVETFKERKLDPNEVPGVLVYGHGPFTWGIHL